ncbi:MAG: GNAT family N-acetyltransferase [Chloroflexi bacterium]|nr:GNAT family N-acetyltransferase [Chloroflexota bacterium]
MTIREIEESDRPDWVRLRESLWPGALSEHDVETRKYFEERLATPVVFVAETEGRVVGFLELDFRKYAPGCRSSPVAFIEGWHVEAGFQRRGIGRALVEAAEARARAMGHAEIASDSDLENADGISAHRALGYEEIERVVCFRRSLSGVSQTSAETRKR